MAQRTSRRKFLKTTAVVGAGYFAASGLRAQESNSPNEQVNIASIGVGGKGDSGGSSSAYLKQALTN